MLGLAQKVWKLELKPQVKKVEPRLMKKYLIGLMSSRAIQRPTLTKSPSRRLLKLNEEAFFKFWAKNYENSKDSLA